MDHRDDWIWRFGLLVFWNLKRRQLKLAGSAMLKFRTETRQGFVLGKVTPGLALFD